MIGNFDKPLSKKLKRAMLAVKVMLASLAVTEFAMQNNGKLGFYILIGVGILDIFVEMFYGEDEQKEG
jgi:hypothetical protein